MIFSLDIHVNYSCAGMPLSCWLVQ